MSDALCLAALPLWDHASRARRAIREGNQRNAMGAAVALGFWRPCAATPALTKRLVDKRTQESAAIHRAFRAQLEKSA